MAYGTRLFDDVNQAQDFGAIPSSVPGELPPDLLQRAKQLDVGIRSLAELVSNKPEGQDKQALQSRLSEMVKEKDDILQGKVKSSMQETLADAQPPAATASPAAKEPGQAPKTLAEIINNKDKQPAEPDYFAQAEAKRKEGEGTLQAKLAEAESKREEARGRADIGQLAETVGRSLAQIGAAQAGMKSGFDLSQAVAGAPRADWEARRKEIQQDYQIAVNDIQDQRRSLETDAARLEKRGEFEEAKRARKQTQALAEKEFEWKKLQDKEQNRLKELEAEAKKLAAGGDKNKTSLDLSKRYRDDDVTKRTTQIRQTTEAAETLYKKQEARLKNNEKASTTDDIALVFAFVRAQDPASTVREGEYKLGSSSGSWTDQFNGLYTMALQGNLTEERRQAMMDTIRAQSEAQERMQTRADNEYQVIVDKLGADSEIVFGRKKKEEEQKTGAETKAGRGKNAIGVEDYRNLPD